MWLRLLIVVRRVIFRMTLEILTTTKWIIYFKMILTYELKIGRNHEKMYNIHIPRGNLYYLVHGCDNTLSNGGPSCAIQIVSPTTFVLVNRPMEADNGTVGHQNLPRTDTSSPPIYHKVCHYVSLYPINYHLVQLGWVSNIYTNLEQTRRIRPPIWIRV